MFLSKYKRRILLFLIDFVIALSCYCFVMIFRDLAIPICAGQVQNHWQNFTVFFVILATSRLATRLYGSVWRYASIRVYFSMLLADTIAGLAFVLADECMPFLDLDAFTCLTISAIVLLATLSSRFFYQGLCAMRRNRAQKLETQQDGRKLAIVGAGSVGVSLAEALSKDRRTKYRPCCFVDIDPAKIGMKINGIRVLADDDAILERIRALGVQDIVIALPRMASEDKNRVYEKFKKSGCRIKIYDQSLSEKDGAGIRDISIEDLLFRAKIDLKNEYTAHFYAGKTVLVTGGGGSIGSEVCRQIAMQGPARLIILDIYENNAYDIQQELVRKYGTELDLCVVIASIRDRARMEEVFSTYRPEIVIHAAAHKHVPLMENSPGEAIKNNVFGTYNCVTLAEKYGVQRFLQISTDKAVNPTNVMGASKRMCEMIVQSHAGGSTNFCAVRFGNVLGSNGSVIPLFRRQIEKGGPVTITDKRIIRYFMTIPEAVGLVLEAGAIAKSGELFVLDMGKPVKILTLAENMIRMAGYVPYQDIDIVEIGLRPGEKLYEELLIKSENLTVTDNEMIFIEKDRAPTKDELEAKLSILREALQDGSREAIYEAFHRAVPTFKDPGEVNKCAEQASEMKQVAD